MLYRTIQARRASRRSAADSSIRSPIRSSVLVRIGRSPTAFLVDLLTAAKVWVRPQRATRAAQSAPVDWGAWSLRRSTPSGTAAGEPKAAMRAASTEVRKAGPGWSVVTSSPSRLRQSQFTDGQTLSVGYDPGGRVSTVTVPTGIRRYAYAATTGQLTTVTAPDGGTLTYTYDGGLVLGEAWGGPAGAILGQVGWTYDADVRVAAEAVNGAHAISYAYDPDSLVTAAGALSLTRDPATALVEIQYTRDVLGRITAKTETVEGVPTTTGYRYDLAGRLDQVTTNGIVTASYGYDANGNRVSRTTASGTETGTSDAQDRLLTYGSASYTYTANGELATKTDAAGTTTYQYDVLGNLLSVTLPNGTRVDYVIDGRNRRIGKKVNGTLVQGWLYRDGLKPVAELDGAGNLVARFVYGTSPLVPDYVVKGGVTYRIISDHLGSPRLVVDTATGVVVQRREYDEWGVVTADTAPGFQPFGFAGGLEDRDTRLVRFGVRDYDPETGRWTAKDPIRYRSDSTNLYGHVLSDPINRADPSGLRTFGVGFGGSGGAGAGGSVTVLWLIDTEGNIGRVTSQGGGGYFGAGGSAGVTYHTSGAPTIHDLNGQSTQLGGSVGEGVSVGGEWVNAMDRSGNWYQGFEVNLGLGAGVFPAETHVYRVDSSVDWSVNVPDLFRRVRDFLANPAAECLPVL